MSGEPGPVEKLSPVLWRRAYKDGRATYLHWCPGCGHGHTYQVPRWSFDGDAQDPSFTPSMRIFVPAGANDDGDTWPEETLCHYFVTNGKILYCSDSKHGLSGQTVDLPPIPEDYGF